MDGGAHAGWRRWQNMLYEALAGPDDLLESKVKKFRSIMSAPEWLRLLEQSLFHLSVDALLTDSPRADFLLFRLLDRVIDAELDPVAVISAFACTCRISAPRYPGVFDKLLTVVHADPYVVVEQWYCACSSACSVAKRMCESKTPAGLALQSQNHIALERILWLHKSEFPLSPDFLVPLFRRAERFNPDQVAMTRDVMASFFPEPEHIEVYAATRLVATLIDAKEGVIDEFPVEQMGLWGRTCRSILPTLVGPGNQPVIFFAALVDSSVTGRDKVVRFLVDMHVDLRVTVENRSIADLAMTENPSFWFSQTKNSAPATAIGGDVSPYLLRRYSHLSLFLDKGCLCICCTKWRGLGDRLSEGLLGLKDWIHAATVDSPDLVPGYRLIELLKQPTVDVPAAVCLLEKGANLSVTDAEGNSALHLAKDAEILEKISTGNTDFNLDNRYGLKPLDLAIISGDSTKAAFLMQECRAELTGFGLERLCGLMPGNRDLVRAVESSARTVTMHKPDPNVYLELRKMKQRLTNEQAAIRQKIQRVETQQEADRVKLVNECEKRVEAQAATHAATVQSLRGELAVALVNKTATEQQLTAELEAKKSLAHQLAQVEEALKKIEKVRAKRESELKQIQASQENRECSLCMAVDWDTALNCGHCYCLNCVKETCKDSCPTCRKKTAGKFIKLFNCRQ